MENEERKMEKYEPVEIEVTVFEEGDIVTASDPTLPPQPMNGSNE